MVVSVLVVHLAVLAFNVHESTLLVAESSDRLAVSFRATCAFLTHVVVDRKDLRAVGTTEVAAVSADGDNRQDSFVLMSQGKKQSLSRHSV